MANLNKVILAGNLTRDPESTQLTSGAVVVKCCVATNRKYKNGNSEWVDDTTFVDFECWNQPAEFLSQYARKGFPVLIEGRLTMQSWEDRNTGQKRSKMFVTAERVQLLKYGEAQTQQQPAYQQPAPVNRPPAPPFPTGNHASPGSETFDVTDESIDDIPF